MNSNLSLSLSLRIQGEYETAIGHFSFDFPWEENELLHLYAPNGSGKTSFVNYLKTFQKDLFLKNNLRVSFLDQFPLSPLGDLRGMDLLNTLKDHLGRAFFDEDFFYSFNSLNSSLALKTPIHFLSGGENQWLKLGLFFAQKSNCLILDEPFNFLDEEKQKKVADLIGERRKDSRVMLILHKDLNFKKLLIKKKGERCYELGLATTLH